jgi:hypothetical protein
VAKDHGQYRAQFRGTYIGIYNTKEEAHAAYCEAAAAYSPEYWHG